jgi:hypothetical protein
MAAHGAILCVVCKPTHMTVHVLVLMHSTYLHCCPVCQIGNPCKATCISDWESGYEQTLWALGYAETSAHHVQFSQIDSLLLSMERDISTQLPSVDWSEPLSYMPVLLLQRDVTGFCFMWSTACRDDNACRLALADLLDMHGRPIGSILAGQQGFPFAEG